MKLAQVVNWAGHEVAMEMCSLWHSTTVQLNGFDMNSLNEIQNRNWICFRPKWNAKGWKEQLIYFVN